MKKLLLITAVLFTIQVANAQSKNSPQTDKLIKELVKAKLELTDIQIIRISQVLNKFNEAIEIKMKSNESTKDADIKSYREQQLQNIKGALTENQLKIYKEKEVEKALQQLQ